MRVALITMVETCRDQAHVPCAMLPLADRTLGQYQIDLAIRAGAEKIFCAVDVVPGQVLGFADHYAAQGIGFELVRGPAEFADQIAPGDEILLIADGLFADAAIAAKFFDGAAKAIASFNGLDDAGAFERMDINHHWAGLALLRGSDIRDIAQLPPEYSLQSALLRCAVQKDYPRINMASRLIQNGKLQFLADAATSMARTHAILDNAGNAMPMAVTRLALQPLARRLAPFAWRSNFAAFGLNIAQAASFFVAPLSGWLGWPSSGLGLVCLGIVFGYLRGSIYPFAEPTRRESLAGGLLALSMILTLLLALWRDGDPVEVTKALYIGVIFIALYVIYALRHADSAQFARRAVCDVLLILLAAIVASVFLVLPALLMVLSLVYAMTVLTDELRGQPTQAQP